jgi:hypothetical protein
MSPLVHVGRGAAVRGWGHTQILALFDRRGHPRYTGLDSQRTTVDHIAFGISLQDF